MSATSWMGLGKSKADPFHYLEPRACVGGASGVGPHGTGMSVPMTLIEDAQRGFPWENGCTVRTQTGVPLLLATEQVHLAIFQSHIHDFRSSTKLGAFTIPPPPPQRTHACMHAWGFLPNLFGHCCGRTLQPSDTLADAKYLYFRGGRGRR